MNSRLTCACAVMLCYAFLTHAASITVPEGPVFYTPGPFEYLAPPPTNGLRFQQAFAAGLFSELPPEPLLITGLAFYSQGPLTNTQFTLSMHLSTTLNPPGGLSRTFASNVGPDDTVVFESLTPVLLSTVTNGQGRNLMMFPFQQEFVYRPQSGNLLLDIHNFFNRPSGLYAAASMPGDVVSSVFFPDVRAQTGVLQAGGYQLQFMYEAVPEPSTLTLFMLAAAVFSALRITKRRRTSGKEPDLENP